MLQVFERAGDTFEHQHQVRGDIFLELLRSPESEGMSQIQTGGGEGVPAQQGD